MEVVMTKTIDVIAEVEGQLNKLQRKFNLLSSWLQLKFHDDPGFPRSILLDSQSQPEDECHPKLECDDEQEEISAREPIPSSANGDIFKIVDLDTILESRSREQRITVRPEDTTPCFVNVERLMMSPLNIPEVKASDKDSLDADLVPGYDDETKDATFRDPEWEPQEDDCDSDTDEQQRLRQELGTDTKRKAQVDRKGLRKVKCPFCKRRYTERSISQHVKTLHKDKITAETLININQAIKMSKLLAHFCNDCNQGFPTPNKLQSHCRIYHPEVYALKLDNGEFKSVSDVLRKRKVDRKGHPTIPCPYCDITCAVKSIHGHVRTQHKDKVTADSLKGINQLVKKSRMLQICQECEQEFQDFRELKCHIQTCHPKLYAQKLARKEFKSVEAQAGVTEQSKDEQAAHYFACPFCKKSYTRRSIYEHIRRRHKDQVTSETYATIRSSILKAGKVIEDRLFCCPVCNDRFKQAHYLRSHMRAFHAGTYSDEVLSYCDFVNSCLQVEPSSTEMISCRDCGIVTESQMEMDAHIDSVHKIGSLFTCAQCGYIAKNYRHLDSHALTHSTLKRFKCSLCPFAAKQHQGLQNHIKRAHQPSRQYQCSLCKEFFKGKYYLTRHVKQVHENLRPFLCPICGTGFKAKSSWDYHIKTHENPLTRKRGINKDRKPKRRKDKSTPNVEPYPATMNFETNLEAGL